MEPVLPSYINPGAVLYEIEQLFKKNLQKQLARSYYPRSYDGVVKPINGGDFGSLHPKNWTSTLSNSINVSTKIAGQIAGANPNWEDIVRRGQIALYAEFGVDYWYYVNYGRKPGVEYEKVKRSAKQGRDARGRFKKKPRYKSYTKMPPLKDILNWVETKPALVSNDLSVETRTYLAMRSIARDGIYGINFIEKAIGETYLDIATIFGTAVSDWFGITWSQANTKGTPLNQRIDVGFVGNLINNPIRRR